jgi:uncharacterized membrane protein (DUF2068 family)
VDWSLRTCGRRGHITYAPDETQLRERLHVETQVGEAWRCLRCGDFVVGEPALAGPAGDAPIVLRGRVLRDAFVLRFLAVERGIRGLIVAAAAYGIVRYAHSENGLRQLFEERLPAAKPLANAFGYDLDKSSIVAEIRHLLLVKTKTLHLIAWILVIYAVIELVEAVGLWLLKRWGEYFAVVATSMFLPYEIYEMIHKFSYFKLGAFILNVAAVVYLLLTKRLFGIRGGHAAYEAERHEESLLEVEEAAGSDLVESMHPLGKHAATSEPAAASESAISSES